MHSLKLMKSSDFYITNYITQLDEEISYWKKMKIGRTWTSRFFCYCTGTIYIFTMYTSLGNLGAANKFETQNSVSNSLALLAWCMLCFRKRVFCNNWCNGFNCKTHKRETELTIWIYWTATKITEFRSFQCCE